MRAGRAHVTTQTDVLGAIEALRTAVSDAENARTGEQLRSALLALQETDIMLKELGAAAREEAWAAVPRLGQNAELLNQLFPMASAQKEDSGDEEEVMYEDGSTPVETALAPLQKVAKFLKLLSPETDEKRSVEAECYRRVLHALGLEAADNFKRPSTDGNKSVGSGHKPFKKNIADLQVLAINNPNVDVRRIPFALLKREEHWASVEQLQKELTSLVVFLNNYVLERTKAVAACMEAKDCLLKAKAAHDHEEVHRILTEFSSEVGQRNKNYKGQGYVGLNSPETQHRRNEGWAEGSFLDFDVQNKGKVRSVALQLLCTVFKLIETAEKPSTRTDSAVSAAREAIEKAAENLQKWNSLLRPTPPAAPWTPKCAAVQLPAPRSVPPSVEEMLLKTHTVTRVCRKNSVNQPLCVTANESWPYKRPNGDQSALPQRDDQNSQERYVPHDVTILDDGNGDESLEEKLTGTNGCYLVVNGTPLERPDGLRNLDEFEPFSPRAERLDNTRSVKTMILDYGLDKWNPPVEVLMAFAGATRSDAAATFSKYELTCWFWRWQWERRWWVRLEYGAHACVVRACDSTCKSEAKSVKDLATKRVFRARVPADTPAPKGPAAFFIEAQPGTWWVAAENFAEATELAQQAGLSGPAVFTSVRSHSVLAVPLAISFATMGSFFAYVFASKLGCADTKDRLAISPDSANRARKSFRETRELLSFGRNSSGDAMNNPLWADMVEKMGFMPFPMLLNGDRQPVTVIANQGGYGYSSAKALENVALIACPRVRANFPIVTPRRMLMNSYRFSAFPSERLATVNNVNTDILRNPRDIRSRLHQVFEPHQPGTSTGRRFYEVYDTKLGGDCQPDRKKLRALPNAAKVEAVFQLLPPLSQTPQQALPASQMQPVHDEAPPHFPADPNDFTPVFVEVADDTAPARQKTGRHTCSHARAMAAMTPDSRIAGFNVARTAAPLRLPSDDEITSWKRQGVSNALHPQ